MSNFSSAQKVLQTIRSGDDVEWIRATNRVKINDHANCVPPFKQEVAKKLGVKLNVNYGELMVLLQHARLQFLSAFWSSLHFFKVRIPEAPPDHASEWGEWITNFINKCMRGSIPYFEVHNSKWAAVTAHGMGPTIWYHPNKWCPKYRAIGDIRISTDVTIDFENLEWFADKHVYTPGELMEEAIKSNSKWNNHKVMNILKNLKNQNWGDALNNYNIDTDAEKIRDLLRQNGGYYSSDAMPGIPLWRFYFEDKTDPTKAGWFMRIVAEQNVVGATSEDFLWMNGVFGNGEWTDERPVSKHWRNIIHCQWGDLNTDAPFKVHAMRSLGFALMEPCFYSNLTLCRMVQHLQDQFNILLRVTDPIDRARATVQEFFNMGVLKPGVSIVPENERHQVDSNLIEMVLAKTKQLQSEAASTYTQQSDTGTNKEETAFAVSVKLQQVNALMSGLLMKAFIYEKPSYEEICRRFCLENSDDEDVIKFRKRATEVMKIPPAWLDVDLWDIEPVTPLGMGNPTAAMAEAQQLMANRGAYAPSGQAEILHDFTLTLTKDPLKASRMAPLGAAKGATPGQKVAEADFNILMRGIPVNQMEGVSTAEQLQTLLGLLAGEISKAEQNGNMASARDIDGFKTVEQHCQGLLQQLAQDPAQKQVEQWGKQTLGKLMNEVKGFEQRLQQQMKKQAQQNGEGGLPSEASAKFAASLMKAHGDIEIKSKKAAQQSVIKDRQHAKDERRKDAAAFAQIERENLLAKASAANKRESLKDE